MIGKVSPRGSRVSGLLYYLFGPGRHEEHTDPHLIAGWRHPAELEPSLRHDGHRDFRHLSGLLQQPHDALGDRGFDRPVWHCSVRAAPSDRMLSDDEWAQLACEIMHRTGLAPYGQEDEAVRWVAVRHAPTTSTWSRCWPAKTAPGPGYGMTTTASARPAAQPSTGSGCAAPPPATGPPRGGRPGRSRRKPAAVAGANHPGSRCAARSPPPQPPPPASESSSPTSTPRASASANGGDPFLAQLRLIFQLAALTEAVIDLRAAQRHAAQAAAARTAAERLYAARRWYTAPSASRARARTHGNQATRDFPISIQQVLAEASAKAYPPESAAASRLSRGPAPPRQRGPTR